ncbi:MAG: VacJ family lipoprotein [Betaproteobacteria bacterium]|nr:VacJ family lipoprotein [Betaproteobacteria bacterium]
MKQGIGQALYAIKSLLPPRWLKLWLCALALCLTQIAWAQVQGLNAQEVDLAHPALVPGPGDLAVEPLSGFHPPDSAAVLASDPFEAMNRQVFDFNEGLDRRLLRPAARVYINTVPRPLRDGFSNMLLNLDDAVSLVNQLLQGKPAKAATSLVRFLFNSSLGLAGFFDIASEAGLYHESEDLGQSFAVWGVPSGPYVVLPLFGPSTLRDASARIIFQPFAPIRQISPSQTRYGLITAGLLASRAELLEASDASGLVVIDRYLFARDAFLQRRRNQIYDGEPPE